MKQIISTLTLLLLGFLGNAQEVNQIPLKELPVKYITVEFQPKTIFSKSYLLIDYGQVPNATFGKELKKLATVTENGARKEFNSEIAALNFLALNSYQLFESFQNISTDVYGKEETEPRKFLMEKTE